MINALNIIKYSGVKNICPNLKYNEGKCKVMNTDNFIYGSSQKAKPIQNYNKGY